jgi:hypothetical protein
MAFPFGKVRWLSGLVLYLLSQIWEALVFNGTVDSSKEGGSYEKEKYTDYRLCGKRLSQLQHVF